jgi:hypothetical protein
MIAKKIAHCTPSLKVVSDSEKNLVGSVGSREIVGSSTDDSESKARSTCRHSKLVKVKQSSARVTRPVAYLADLIEDSEMRQVRLRIIGSRSVK